MIDFTEAELKAIYMSVAYDVQQSEGNYQRILQSVCSKIRKELEAIQRRNNI